MNEEASLKDEVLWKLSLDNNVARFASFDPEQKLRFARLSEKEIEPSGTPEEIVSRLLDLCASVNIRTFLPRQASGNPFVYGLTSTEIVLKKMLEFGNSGYFCLINETISINDGGISGVVDQGVVEFSPDDTPRAVEKPGVCALPLSLANIILEQVYKIPNPIPARRGQRVEFSLHPNRVGVRNEHTLVWESAPSQLLEHHKIVPNWPNNFSRHVGDKVFGLLVADGLGLPIPSSTVVGRRVAPFTFGQSTKTGETWIRTCPLVQQPGKYTTTNMWTDPFALMQGEDPTNLNIQSLIFQEGVQSKYSGATYPIFQNSIIEGIAGTGDDFMSGSKAPEPLPPQILKDVIELVKTAESRVESRVRIEWVHDGNQVWIVQLHVVTQESLDSPMYHGEKVTNWIDFDPDTGISALSKIIAIAKKNGNGVRVTRSIGFTSHVGDLLRKNQVPFKIKEFPLKGAEPS